MINIKEYIESGVLEDYLSGNVSEQERREVECLSKIYPEIKAELEQLSEAVERYAFAHSVSPPASLKEKIMAQLEFKEEEVQEQVEIPEFNEDDVQLIMNEVKITKEEAIKALKNAKNDVIQALVDLNKK